jgi:2-dehydro-3-deoxy-D-arabinonate dehydratase
MDLTHHNTPTGPRWAADGFFLPADLTLGRLLQEQALHMARFIMANVTEAPADGPLLAPIEPHQEVWASGVTYLRSREARQAESSTGDIYQRVYEAERPELFYKAAGWRVVGPGNPVRVRADSRWNVPEPELTLLLNTRGEICGFTAGNDVSSRDIEGDNPLYLPQAKVYNASCALGPYLRLVPSPTELVDIDIKLAILRGGQTLFQGETGTASMKRSFSDLASYLFRELDFPHGAFLLTGTGIVPPEAFSLQPGDLVQVIVDDLVLENPVL